MYFYTICRRETARSELVSAEQIVVLAHFPHKICVCLSPLRMFCMSCASLFLFYIVCMSLAIWCSSLRTPSLIDGYQYLLSRQEAMAPGMILLSKPLVEIVIFRQLHLKIWFPMSGSLNWKVCQFIKKLKSMFTCPLKYFIFFYNQWCNSPPIIHFNKP